ncbi:hypothetical protein NQ314_013675 [Rhamnusium bicolor]|uniref:Uncharacterized protein n=1 Tax=Rhamnusium bicolor TaxID=1586634 RepID=A0AAV8X5F6_9CUCU|nr:hypothetical protein NQ314_013675 [Rhamnusium bicolor]
MLVKFSVDEPEKEKSVKFDAVPPQQKQQNGQSQQFNMPLRTQSFNQNHPAFPIAPPAQPDYLTSLRNVPNVQLDKGTNYQFPKSDNLPQNIPNIGMQIMPPYQNMQHPQNNVNMNVNMGQKPPGGYQQSPLSQNSFNTPQMSTPYQNMSFPSSHPFNTWKREEIPPLPNPSWWQNTSQPPPSQNYRQDNYSINFPPYSNNMPSYLQQSNPMMSKHDFNKPQSSQGGGDIFSSPWSNYSSGYLNEGGTVGFENSNQGMSMRQAMLKEANLPGTPVGPPGSTVNRMPNVSTITNSSYLTCIDSSFNSLASMVNFNSIVTNLLSKYP